MAPKNILLIIPELSMGGAQRSLTNLSVELAKDNNVWLVIFDRDHEVPYNYGGTLISLDVQSGTTWFKKLRALLKRVSRLRALKIKLDIQFSLSYLEGADYVNILSRVRERVVISVRGSKYFDRQISGVLGWIRLNLLMPILYRKADQVVCVSEGIREEMIGRMGLAPETTSTIHNFCDLSFPFKDVNQHGDNALMPSLGFSFVLGIGRFHAQKNFKGLISVFALVRKDWPDLKLVILGDGEERANLQAWCAHLGLRIHSNPGSHDYLASDVLLLGFQNPAPFLERAQLYVLSSLWEGFPNSLIEAIASGTASVAADCPTGPREILAPGTTGQLTMTAEQAVYGMLLPVLNSDIATKIWADEISKLLGDPGRLEYYRMSGKHRAKDFATEGILSKWYELIA